MVPFQEEGMRELWSWTWKNREQRGLGWRDLAGGVWGKDNAPNLGVVSLKYSDF